ncbi:circularly permuted type 2 ATP-grasp protein [Aquibacillus koreensis]|uniref:Circularly permuted type 2 ATP-grasp protein n=1 Tax=Aquibacillus koreensis TaxID=279446 RepID=A0A9X3WM10_9BACI|nr:circularly permuted type 2 ATP-grasp protein [Aquibacillus koreensis]MCT2534274.1 circularly permuted type 2 ATP-grasp protein [Aquibacillus koreensis]MDC3420681.1 circularly permuted type 2 ATP-grasp protein [Aquibacillus koreensis]
MFRPYKTAPFFDEMLRQDGLPKPHYHKFHQILNQFSQDELKKKHETAQLSFLRQGITFTVYDANQNTERTMPFDFIPVIIPSKDWDEIERGMIQRTEALNLFLEDIYNEQYIIKDGLIPRELVEENPYYYGQQMKGMKIPLRNHIFLAGIDLVRNENGQYLVLEDNLRNPSGMSYVYQNRYVMRQVYPEFFSKHSLITLEHQLSSLHDAILSHKPLGLENGVSPRAVLLTPGIYNSAYYDHVFLAQQMGLELVEGRDLLVKHDKVYMKTIKGLERVHIIYRRIDDDYLDPVAFHKDSTLGVTNLLQAYRKGNVSILNGIGNGVADDKAMYAYVPDMIRYYLKEEPIIPNVETYRLREKKQRDWVLERLEQLVIKNVGASGGYDMLIGPHASKDEIESFRNKILEKPYQYIAQPMIKLSRAPSFQNERFYPCHVDLRVFVMRGEETNVLPGGLSRVALKEGSLVVNSSQGGGGKDTWILKSDRGDEQHAQ